MGCADGRFEDRGFRGGYDGVCKGVNGNGEDDYVKLFLFTQVPRSYLCCGMCSSRCAPECIQVLWEGREDNDVLAILRGNAGAFE
jgi:hypothetical protein